MPLTEAASDDEPALDSLAAAALAKLVIDQALQRAAVAHPYAESYRVGVAVRVPAGGYATAVLTVPTLNWFAILAALQKAP